MTSVYLAFYYDKTTPAPNSRSRYLGAFKSADDVISHMNETSSGNKPFVGSALTDLKPSTIVACKDFDPIVIFVASVAFTGRTKAIYVNVDSCTVDIRKIKDATYTIPITVCPMCGNKCVAADDDGHCSYECATGT